MTLTEDFIKQELRTFICTDLLDRSDYPLRDDHSLINGGILDSFAVVDLVVFIEERFGIYIPNDEMDVERMDTLETLARYTLEWRNGPAA